MALEPASPELVAAIHRRRSLIIAMPGTEELRFLDFCGAEASVNGTEDERPYHSIIIRDPPLKAALLEEFLHGTQAKLGIIERRGVPQAEAHVKRFMIRHRRCLGLGAEDVAVLRLLLAKGL